LRKSGCGAGRKRRRRSKKWKSQVDYTNIDPPTPQAITNLSGGKVWFSQPAQFNDPFDCAYNVVLSELNTADCIEFLKDASDGRFNETNPSKLSDEALHQQVADGMKAAVAQGLSAIRGICCFSEVHNNPLMWGHYSDGHRGFCLEFDTTSDPLFKKTKRVRYSTTFPVVSIKSLRKAEYEQILDLVLTKAKCWEYEKEWRVLHNQCDLLFGYERSSLSAVYFGAKMPEDQMHMLASLMERTDTKLYRMRASKSSFELVAEEISFTPIDYRCTTNGNRPS
jgi:hypothetical protein